MIEQFLLTKKSYLQIFQNIPREKQLTYKEQSYLFYYYGKIIVVINFLNVKNKNYRKKNINKADPYKYIYSEIKQRAINKSYTTANQYC